MRKNENTSVMTCGACAVIMDENGETTTSIDVLVNGVKRLFAKRVSTKNFVVAVSR